MKVVKFFGLTLSLCLIVCGVILLLPGSSAYYGFDEVEVLADTEEGYASFCRCHSDGSCQLGNYISFRPSCGTLFSTEPFVPDCSALSSNCS